MFDVCCGPRLFESSAELIDVHLWSVMLFVPREGSTYLSFSARECWNTFPFTQVTQTGAIKYQTQVSITSTDPHFRIV